MTGTDLTSLTFDDLLNREWLAALGNGSFASSTLCGLNTRKYHGLLVAAMAPPVRRMVMLSRVEETVRVNGSACELACNEYPGTIHPRGHEHLRAFCAEPFPRWAYQGDGFTLEKQLRPVLGQNTVVLSYTLLGAGAGIELELRPLFALRGIHDLMYQWNAKLDPQSLSASHHRIPATTRSPEVFFAHNGSFAPQPCWYLNTIYRRERERGYAGLEDLWMPGVIRWTLLPGQTVHFVCSTDPIDFDRAVAEADRTFETAVAPLLTQRPDPILEALFRAAEQFVVRCRDGVPAIIGSYPWGSAAGRDAMISLPGLLLITGKIDEAGSLLAEFASAMKDGLMPSDLAEDGSGYRYTAADTSLWFIHALGQYVRYHGSQALVREELLPAACAVIERYRAGTSLGIAVDANGLLVSRAPGIPTTWMDAKIGDWVVTPRQGRPVSLNALWYNALRTVAELCRRFDQPRRVEEMLRLAQRAREAFNDRFWNDREGCCFDVVEDIGADPAIRPNQVLAMSLPYPVLELPRHAQVLRKLKSLLLTPVGLRTLAPSEPSYQGRYAGSPAERDRACHQGSAFPWLLGPLVTAHTRVFGRGQASLDEARSIIDGCIRHLTGIGTGQIAELFDGDPPHHPGGAIASARSVAELLRCYVQDILGIEPPGLSSPVQEQAPADQLRDDPIRDPVD